MSGQETNAQLTQHDEDVLQVSDNECNLTENNGPCLYLRER